mmetsp:Transcript_32523/g.63646  ORF Transcript_32523/g.63646 Transcript_32523/m.63646 type:complete len:105 (+) Transcript_32523:220-534(+)
MKGCTEQLTQGYLLRGLFLCCICDICLDPPVQCYFDGYYLSDEEDEDDEEDNDELVLVVEEVVVLVSEPATAVAWAFSFSTKPPTSLPLAVEGPCPLFGPSMLL